MHVTVIFTIEKPCNVMRRHVPIIFNFFSVIARGRCHFVPKLILPGSTAPGPGNVRLVGTKITKDCTAASHTHGRPVSPAPCGSRGTPPRSIAPMSQTPLPTRESFVPEHVCCAGVPTSVWVSHHRFFPLQTQSCSIFVIFLTLHYYAHLSGQLSNLSEITPTSCAHNGLMDLFFETLGPDPSHLRHVPSPRSLLRDVLCPMRRPSSGPVFPRAPAPQTPSFSIHHPLLLLFKFLEFVGRGRSLKLPSQLVCLPAVGGLRGGG